ncbi:MAG: prepilin-type N-terminal cleavage/methylation domain-containing protein [Verrucomicrobiota bacterium]
MKPTPSITRKSGMTLLELTVVILVLLSLVSILFVGAQAWKKGTDRASCILNIRNVQQAVRGHQNLFNLAEGTDLPRTTIYSNTTGAAYLKIPVCPSSGTYDETLTKVPATGILYLPCSKASVANGSHQPADYSAW